MKIQALKINTWGKNVYVKVPVYNSKGNFMGKIIKDLNKKDIKLNITAVYTAKQTEKILRLINKKTNVIISIFAGRAADTGKDPLPEFKKSISLAKNFKNVEILWASVREPYNYLQAQQLGCHIITVPPSIIEKIEKFGKSFTTLTKETVKAFLIDSKNLISGFNYLLIIKLNPLHCFIFFSSELNLSKNIFIDVFSMYFFHLPANIIFKGRKPPSYWK